MSEQGDGVQVRKIEPARLYEAVVGGTVIGTLAYETAGGRIALTHSFVDPDHRNKGVASALAEFALDDVVSSGDRPIVYCGFVADYIDTHPRWQESADVAHLALIPTRTAPTVPPSADYSKPDR